MIFNKFLVSSDIITGRSNMACLKQKSLLDLPDEVLEKMMTFLSFGDLYKLKKQGKRLADCTERVLKKKPFSKCMIIIIWLFRLNIHNTFLVLPILI